MNPEKQKEKEKTEAGAPASESSADPKALTPEEQMAKFEESLKEDDWGHQPC